MNKCRLITVTTFYFILLFFVTTTKAQTKNITGKVINTITGQSIPNVKITIRGYPKSFLSNDLGEFAIYLSDTVSFEKNISIENMEILEIKQISENNYLVYLSESNPFDLSFDQLLNIKVNVSSSKSQTLFQTPSTVSIIDHEILNKYNYLSLAEILRTTVGVDIYQTNIDDNIATFRGILQNYYANKILVMIENIPTYQPIYGNTNLDRIDVNDIERIEVLKGPASVLYGSNAYMGVVNIILKKNNNGDVNIRLGAGYHRFGSSGANVTVSKNKFNLFISGNTGYEIQKPYEVTSKRQDAFLGDTVYQFKRELKSTNFNIISSYKSISVLLNTYEYQHTFLGINPSFKSGGGKPKTDRGTLLALKYNKEISSKSTLLADVAFDLFKRDFTSTPDGTNALTLSGNRLTGRVKFGYEITSKLDIETGVDIERRMHGKHEDINSLKDTVLRSNFKNPKNIDEHSAFAQLNFKSKYINILGGLRYTHNSFAGGNFSGRISAITEINNANSIKLIYGQSFRAPTMLELFFDHPTVIGNLNLKPEKANSYEFAYVYGKNIVFIQMLLYYNKLEQLIQRITPNTGPPSEYRNISSFEGYGFEFEGKYQNPRIINAFFTYNYMAGLGENAISNFQHVPKHTVKLGVSKPIGNFFISTNSYAITSVLGNPKLNTTIGSQYFIDIHFGYIHSITEKNITIQHKLSAKNITSSQMLIPEYIRLTDNINSQATSGNGFRLIYIMSLSF